MLIMLIIAIIVFFEAKKYKHKANTGFRKKGLYSQAGVRGIPSRIKKISRLR